MKPQISIVIPTCNRKESLRRTLGSAALQLFPAMEVIVVDASAEALDPEALRIEFPQLNIRYCTSKPSVCIQRNIGIKLANAPYVFLCDDDIEMPPDYLSKIADYLSENDDAGIVTGLVLQKNKTGEWEYQYRPTSFLKFVWNYIFQLTVWGDFSLIKSNFVNASLINFIKKRYAKRGNGYTRAGWPLLTTFNSPVTRSSVYGLGAAVVKKEWLLASPFDENLVPNGIGDNYGITANLPYDQPIHILTAAHVWHHCEPANRLKSITAYRYRIFALHYFMVNSTRFSPMNIWFLYWSLYGNILSQTFTLQLRLAATSFTTLITLMAGQNPYMKKAVAIG
ncbi:MAG: glycosyltransferase family 2 protein [Bacteroidota bacterium]